MRGMMSTGWIAFALGLVTSTATAATVPECSQKDVDAARFSPNSDFFSVEMPEARTVVFSSGSNANFATYVDVKLTDSGAVASFRVSQWLDFGPPWPLKFPRSAVARAAATWHFPAPKGRVGRWGSQAVRFERAPVPRVSAPAVPDDQMGFQHIRTNCYGPCPAYTVTVHGDGRVEYDGGSTAGLVGPLAYRIPVADVRALIARQAARDLWNAKDQYVALETDSSHNVLKITAGARSKTIHDYIGEQMSMPASVREAEDDIDAVAAVDRWIHVTPDSLRDLESLGFDFRSQQAADMLVNMIRDKTTGDDGIVAVIARGAPFSARQWSSGGIIPDKMRPMLDEAIAANRPIVAERLIAAGALTVGGAPDKTRVNSAFRAALESGSLVFVQRLAEFHPHLTYRPDEGSEEQSVLFLLRSGGEQSTNLLVYLVGIGADPASRDADGNTLLHMLGDDPKSADFLLAHGVDINAKNAEGETALLTGADEDAVLHLLDLGADPTLHTDAASIWSRADIFEWKRVPAWLQAHNYQRPK